MQRKNRKSLYDEDERTKERKGMQKERDRRPRGRQVPGKTGRCSFSFPLLGQNWLWVNAAAEGLQRRTEMMERMQRQEVQVKGGRWAEEITHRWRQPKGEGRTEILLDGSTWSTERKYMRRFNGKCDVFFGIEHSLRKEEMEVQQRGEGRRRMQRESWMKEQAVRIVSTHQEEFLWQSTATWEQLLERKSS